MEIYGKLVLSLITAYTIGFLSVKYDKQYPIRIFILICLGATLLTIVSTEFFRYANYPWTSDPGRLSAQIISALGFMLAGFIWVGEDNNVEGISEASSLWLVAILGMLIGAGLNNVLILAVFFIIVIYFISEKFIKSKKM